MRGREKLRGSDCRLKEKASHLILMQLNDILIVK
jgi:hypothetical protein